MYQALYRKYRPRCFCDMTGQEHVTETLRRQIVSGRLSHAYLFVGTRGTGKTTCAKVLSRAVNCLDSADGEPCNKCKSCAGIENGSILDVLELDAASNNGVDNVRALREEAIYTPASVRKRVYIVDEVHMLSTAAFNALLKILEEPPEHLIFILATTELHKVPATILSRCQRFSFRRISPAAIAERLRLVAEKEGLDLTLDAAEKLAALADGSMRDGLSLLDQCASDTLVDLPRVLDTIGLAGQRELLMLADAVADRDTTAALSVLDLLYDDGRDMASLLNELAALLRDILVFIISPNSPLLSGGFSHAELSGLSKKLSPERLFSCLEMIRESVLGLSRGGSVRLSSEMCLIRICEERLSYDTQALLSRIVKLESNSEFGIRNSELATGKPVVNDKDANMQQISDTRSSKICDSADNVESKEMNQSNTDQPAESEVCHGQPTNDGDPTDNSVLIATESGFWQDILGLLKRDIPVHALLSDSAKIQAEQQDGKLIIRVGDLFTASSIESKMISEPLKEAASKVLGREIVIKVLVGESSSNENKRDKLERLSAFNVIQFE